MCNRFDQHNISDLINDFAWAAELLNRSSAEPSWNVAPTHVRPVMRLEAGSLLIDDLYWGYQAPWAEGKVPVARNAKVEKLEGGYWGPLLKRWRVLVPANGWYEWTGEKGNKQGWHIHRKAGELLYIAGLASFAEPTTNKANNGFVMVTADAAGGLVDVHDRRPVVFSAADAATWLDPELSGEQAAEMARSMGLGPEHFDWHKVGKAVGNVNSIGPELAQPVA